MKLLLAQAYSEYEEKIRDAGLYVNLETGIDRNASYVFRNISKNPLNISGEELKARFVRGDSARTGEGSGLGLSIAESMMKLQGGTLKIGMDGDRFKAEVTLEKV